MSKYIYAHNNPSMYVDPHGEWVLLAMFAVTFVIGFATNFEDAYNSGERNWLKLIGVGTLGGVTSTAAFSAGFYGGPLGAIAGSAIAGWVNGGGQKLIRQGKWDNEGAKVGLYNGAFSGALSAGINYGGSTYLTKAGLEGVDFFAGTTYGVLKTWGDRKQQEENRKQANCYLNQVCVDMGK